MTSPPEPHTRVGRIRPCESMTLQNFCDARGSLSIVEGRKDLGFDINRVFYVYDLPRTTMRGDHAHRNLEQFVIAVHGSFDVTVDDTFSTGRIRLDDPNTGLYIGPMVWNGLVDFSPGAVALVLASHHYDEADYYRVYEEFVADARKLA